MHAEVLKKWLIALLQSNTYLAGLSVQSGELNALPTTNGIYVVLSYGNQDVRNLSESQEVRLVVVASSEQLCFDACKAIKDLLQFTPGTIRSWNVSPSTHQLRLRDIDLITMQPPMSEDIGNRSYRATLVYNVRGQDMR